MAVKGLTLHEQVLQIIGMAWSVMVGQVVILPKKAKPAQDLELQEVEAQPKFWGGERWQTFAEECGRGGQCQRLPSLPHSP